ncbi:MAG: oxidoreductase, partial [Chloroflexi bacterium]|nr:oxidoreductase [Chloroflexota bacterium]
LPHEPLTERVERATHLAERREGPRRLEMEYVLPRQHAREAIERVTDLVRRGNWQPSLPAVLRWSAPDTIPLSMGYRREAASITVRARPSEPFQPLFEAVETVMRDYEGRPHWGKVHFQTHETLRPLYPRWDEFQSTRRRLDPRGVFANAYTDRVLGVLR